MVRGVRRDLREAVAASEPVSTTATNAAAALAPDRCFLQVISSPVSDVCLATLGEAGSPARGDGGSYKAA